MNGSKFCPEAPCNGFVRDSLRLVPLHMMCSFNERRRGGRSKGKKEKAAETLCLFLGLRLQRPIGHNSCRANNKHSPSKCKRIGTQSYFIKVIVLHKSLTLNAL